MFGNVILITTVLFGTFEAKVRAADKNTCPCVMKPNKRGCMAYDHRYQAANIQEALLNFPDLTMVNVDSASAMRLTSTPIAGKVADVQQGPDKSDGSNSSSDEKPTGECSTDECQTCSQLLLDRLQTVGAIQSKQIDVIRRKLSLKNRTNQMNDCPKYNVQINPKPMPKAGKLKLASNYQSRDNSVDNLIANLSRKGDELWRLQLNTMKRNTRDTSGMIGQRFKIGCVKRGDPLDKKSEWATFCDVCWVWRKLPQEYFPSYINELLCDTDLKCLSGWGKCQQQYRNIDVLQNTGTADKPNWRAVTLESSNYCDCSVQTGSALHSFIAA